MLNEDNSNPEDEFQNSGLIKEYFFSKKRDIFTQDNLLNKQVDEKNEQKLPKWKAKDQFNSNKFENNNSNLKNQNEWLSIRRFFPNSNVTENSITSSVTLSNISFGELLVTDSKKDISPGRQNSEIEKPILEILYEKKIHLKKNSSEKSATISKTEASEKKSFSSGSSDHKLDIEDLENEEEKSENIAKETINEFKDIKNVEKKENSFFTIRNSFDLSRNLTDPSIFSQKLRKQEFKQEEIPRKSPDISIISSEKDELSGEKSLSLLINKDNEEEKKRRKRKIFVIILIILLILLLFGGILGGLLGGLLPRENVSISSTGKIKTTSKATITDTLTSIIATTTATATTTSTTTTIATTTSTTTSITTSITTTATITTTLLSGIVGSPCASDSDCFGSSISGIRQSTSSIYITTHCLAYFCACKSPYTTIAMTGDYRCAKVQGLDCLDDIECDYSYCHTNNKCVGGSTG